jgi:hypothetical protein
MLLFFRRYTNLDPSTRSFHSGIVMVIWRRSLNVSYFRFVVLFFAMFKIITLISCVSGMLDAGYMCKFIHRV